MKRNLFFITALLFLQVSTTIPEVWESALAPVANPRAVESAPAFAVPPAPPLTHVSIPTAAPARQVDLAIDTPVPTTEPVAANVERVLIVSFDGMRPDAIAAAHMTNLLNLMKSSAYTLSARTISYPTTLPSHTSMLSGMCMEKHGMRFNSRNLYKGYSRGTDVFDLTHNADLKSVMIVAKDKLEQIPSPTTVDVLEIYGYEAPIAKAAIRIIPSGFSLMFLHFPSADLVGHKFGWMSNMQFAALRRGDDALGQVLAALDENGMRETTLVIVNADHGGHGTTHDGTVIEDYLIPWIVSGPGVVPGELHSTIKIMDTAATAAYALGLPQPPAWDGLPVYEAFGIIPQDIHYRAGPCE